MIRHVYLSLLILLCSACSSILTHEVGNRKTSAVEVKVGVLGDTHGQKNALLSALRRMKSEGVSELIVLGDIVPWNLKSPHLLRPILEMIQNEIGLDSKHIHFAIGNAEEDVLAEWLPKIRKMKAENVTEEQLLRAVEAGKLDYDEMREKFFNKIPFEQTEAYQMFQEFGDVQNPGPNGYAFIKVENKTIAYSHYNMRPVPESMLQPTDAVVTRIDPKTGKEVEEIVNFRNPHTVQKNRISAPYPKNADLAFYGDIHIGGLYFDIDAKKAIVNAGVLNQRFKDASEPQAFSIYNVTKNELQFWNSKSDELISTFNLEELTKSAKKANAQMIFKLATLCGPK